MGKYGTFRNVLIFPGSKSEFEDYMGYETDWIKDDDLNKGLYAGDYNYFSGPAYSQKYVDRLTSEGIVAIVRAHPLNHPNKYSGKGTIRIYYGLPVKKKEDANE